MQSGAHAKEKAAAGKSRLKKNKNTASKKSGILYRNECSRDGFANFCFDEALFLGGSMGIVL